MFFFQAACQFNAKSGAIDQVTLDDQSVDVINLLGTVVYFGVSAAFPFGQNFEHSTSSFMQSTLAKRQFEFVVFVSYLGLLYFIL